MLVALASPMTQIQRRYGVSSACAESWNQPSDLADGDRRPVRGDLAHHVGELVGIEAHGDDGIAAHLVRGVPEPGHCFLAAIGEQLRVAAGLPTEHGAKARAMLENMFRERTTSPKTSPCTWVISYPGTSFIVETRIGGPL